MKIPEYDLNVSLPSPGPTPTVPAEVAAAPWVGLAKVGDQTAELGKVIQEKQDEIFRVKDVTDRSIQAENKISDLMISLEKERDPQTAPTKFSEGMADIKNEVMEGVSDYKVASSLTTHLAAKEIEGVTKVKHAAWTWTLQNDQEDMMSQNDRWKKAAVNSPDQVDYAAGQIQSRIAASVATGSIKPETGRLLLEKERKDLYVQVMSQMMLNDPKSAPDAIKPLLVKSGLDPNDIWAMEQRAEHARTAFENKSAKGDKVIWEKNSAQASIQIRAGNLKETDVNEMFALGKIGPEQLQHLQSVLDSVKTHADAENTKTSYRAMNDILMDVFTNRTTPERAARTVDGNANILPEHKTHAMQTLLAIGRGADRIPPQMEKAKQILLTKVAPSFLSMNPRAEEKEAAGEVLREMYTDYFANEKKYQSDPDLLIKRAIEKTKPEAVDFTSVPNSPYKDKADLLKAYDYYVVKRHPSPNGLTPKHYWERWFSQVGEVMPPWPR